MNTADIIKKRREELGLSQEELAAKLGYKSRSSINKIELGLSDIPFSKIPLFAKALELEPEILMGWGKEKVNVELEEVLKSHNKYPKTELKGDFTITENIEGEYIRILSVFNDRTADERIYDLKTNKYNEKKINKIIISFNIDNEDYTAEDTNKFIKLFSEYKKLSDDKQKEIDSIIYGKEKRNNYIDYINFSESFDKDTFLDIKNYYKIPTTTETKKSLIKSNCIISTFYTLDLNTTKNIKSTVLEKDSDSKNVLSDKIYIPKVSLKNNESNTKK